MLVPLAAAVATGAFALDATVGSFERASGEATDSAIPIVSVQAALGPASISAFLGVTRWCPESVRGPDPRSPARHEAMVRRELGA
ncbi:MAG: hypothetical protein ACXVKA_15285 [Acidimicrobiia bacterium]